MFASLYSTEECCISSVEFFDETNFLLFHLQKFLGEDCSTSENAGPSISDDNDDKEGDKDSKKKKNRCAVCRKKVGLTGKYKQSYYSTTMLFRKFYLNVNGGETIFKRVRSMGVLAMEVILACSYTTANET